MYDLHCHILPGVDDGAPDLDAAVAMARCLVEVGYAGVTASPHLGEGPGGDVPPDVAQAAREQLVERLGREGVALEVLPSSEHHLTPDLFDRLDRGDVVPIGGASRWLLVELPWRAIPDPEGQLFRVQAKGYRLLLAHPERYSYIELDALERMVGRGIKMQLEIGSFVGLYGKRSLYRALEMCDRGLGHVLASDMHRSDDAVAWMRGGLRAVAERYGRRAVEAGTLDNPRAMIDDAQVERVLPITEAR